MVRYLTRRIGWELALRYSNGRRRSRTVDFKLQTELKRVSLFENDDKTVVVVRRRCDLRNGRWKYTITHVRRRLERTRRQSYLKSPIEIIVQFSGVSASDRRTVSLLLVITSFFSCTVTAARSIRTTYTFQRHVFSLFVFYSFLIRFCPFTFFENLFLEKTYPARSIGVLYIRHDFYGSSLAARFWMDKHTQIDSAVFCSEP